MSYILLHLNNTWALRGSFMKLFIIFDCLTTIIGLYETLLWVIQVYGVSDEHFILETPVVSHYYYYYY